MLARQRSWREQTGARKRKYSTVQKIRNNVLPKFRTIEAALNQEGKEQSISGVLFRGELSEKWKAEPRPEKHSSHNLREIKECYWTSYNNKS
jgi:hypothetical protein